MQCETIVDNKNVNGEPQKVILKLYEAEVVTIAECLKKPLQHLLVDCDSLDNFTPLMNKIKELLAKEELTKIDGSLIILKYHGHTRENDGKPLKGCVTIDLDNNEITIDGILKALLGDLKKKILSLSKLALELLETSRDFLINFVQYYWNQFCQLLILVGDTSIEFIDNVLLKVDFIRDYISKKLQLDPERLNGRIILQVIKKILSALESKLHSQEIYLDIFQKIYENFKNRIEHFSEAVKKLFEVFEDIMQYWNE